MHEGKKSTGNHPEAGDVEDIEVKGAALHFPNQRVLHSDTPKLKALKEHAGSFSFTSSANDL